MEAPLGMLLGLSVVMLAVLAPWAAAQGGLQLAVSSIVPQMQTTYSWTVSITPDKQSISVPVGTNMGWAQVKYTVSCSRTRNQELTYVLSGTLAVQETAGQTLLLQEPVVTVNPPSRAPVTLNSSDVNCPSLTLPANGQLSCAFSAAYTGNQPMPGTVTASISTTDGSSTAIAANVPYNFAGADSVGVGQTAAITNWFEQGANVIQPYGVSGTQPPPGLVLEEGRDFEYIAFFGNVPASQCGQQWQALSSASVTPTVEGLTQAGSASTAAQQAISSVAITLVNCGTSGSDTVDFSDITNGGGTPTVPGTPPAASPSPAPTVIASQAPAGVEFAQAGSTLCGGGACAPGQRCFDGWNCCATQVEICGGVCCDNNRVCLLSQCVAQGSIPCGSAVCQGGQTCNSGVCCSADRVVCGSACCEQGQQCINGQCAATGSTACGGSVCDPTQTCATGICCPAGQVNCGGKCCGGGNTCLQGQFCVPLGSTVCGATVCQSPQQCAGGAVCCDPGASFCAGTCCPSGNTCSQNQCLQPGQSICGGSVCSQGQTCQGGVVCCDASATFCNNGCCASGNVCINNVCAPLGSTACGTTLCPVNQFCGDPQTGTCCQNQNQVGCFNTCCNTPQQVCNQFTRQCVDRINTACTGGQTWCPGANQCCSAGLVCAVGACVAGSTLPGDPRPVFGRRLLVSHAEQY
ncbi:hypothetical protein COO60DRAFT_1508952 [Scenedesmus sp. NREL 46B-D3]|nr:hypothetical protein COO60DRAFT_1508952 [Scenedesmus sp. NREL 46B-D3]